MESTTWNVSSQSENIGKIQSYANSIVTERSGGSFSLPKKVGRAACDIFVAVGRIAMAFTPRQTLVDRSTHIHLGTHTENHSHSQPTPNRGAQQKQRNKDDNSGDVLGLVIAGVAGLVGMIGLSYFIGTDAGKVRSAEKAGETHTKIVNTAHNIDDSYDTTEKTDLLNFTSITKELIEKDIQQTTYLRLVPKIMMFAASASVFAGACIASTPAILGGTALFVGAICIKLFNDNYYAEDQKELLNLAVKVQAQATTLEQKYFKNSTTGDN